MAGCAKAGRCKNSPSQKRYKAENHYDINRNRRATRLEKEMQRKSSNNAKVPRGTARAARRTALQREGATSF